MRNVLITVAVVASISVLLLGFAIAETMTLEIKTDRINTRLARVEDVTMEHWAALSQKKIFFAHTELGNEIIDGMKAIMTEHDYIRLNIAETADPTAFDRPTFAHAQAGRCMDPDSKISHFKDLLNAGLGQRVSVACLKFCYNDVIWESDAHAIFRNYQKMVEQLKSSYPNVKFLHVTVPICSRPSGSKKILRESVKLLAGRPSIFDDNVRRAQYNDFLRAAYSQTEAVFDLALLESIDPHGFRCYTRTRGIEKVPAKAPQYSVGSAHFNTEGRKIIAEQLLTALAEMAE